MDHETVRDVILYSADSQAARMGTAVQILYLFHIALQTAAYLSSSVSGISSSLPSHCHCSVVTFLSFLIQHVKNYFCYFLFIYSLPVATVYVCVCHPTASGCCVMTLAGDCTTKKLIAAADAAVNEKIKSAFKLKTHQ